MTANKLPLGIKRVASIHMFVRDLERSRDHYVERLAHGTLEFEQEQRARASVVEAGGARFVLIEPLGSAGESYHWLRKHPEGIGCVVFDVEDATRTRLSNTSVGTIDEDITTLRELEILVDGEGEGRYLLQIFMKETAAAFGDVEAGPFFIELIQRKGDSGFGGGNFRALFDSIEQQQQIDGRG